jgi:peptidoglycan hydrolase-like protein with peptidoglycan-binding domain
MAFEITKGAWVWGPYRYLIGHRMGVIAHPDVTIDEIRQNCAVKSIQERLYTVGLDPGRKDGVFGFRTSRAVRKFQRRQGLKPDGNVGRTTMGELWRGRILKEAESVGVPKELAVGIALHESGLDPAAVGASTPPEKGTDRGLVQINSLAHPTTSDLEAYDFAYSIKWENTRLAMLGVKYHSKPELQWTCAVAANLSPVSADAWFAAEAPPNPTIEKFVKDAMAFGEAYWA